VILTPTSSSASRMAQASRFKVVEFTADDAPVVGFGRAFAEGQEDAALLVGQEDADAHFRDV
jgi:hypothetical protein